jgi:uncharacterized membrane protein
VIRPRAAWRLLVETVAGLIVAALLAGLGVAVAWGVSQRPQPWHASAVVDLTSSVPDSPALDTSFRQLQTRYVGLAGQPGFTVQVARTSGVAPGHLTAPVTGHRDGTHGIRVEVAAVGKREATTLATAAAQQLAALVATEQQRTVPVAAERITPFVSSRTSPAQDHRSVAVLVAFAAGAAAAVALPLALLLTGRRRETDEPRPVRGVHRALLTGAALAGVAGVNVLVLSDVRVPVVGAALGVWAALGAPAFLLHRANPLGLVRSLERFLVSVLGAVLLLMLSGLATSVVAGPLGLRHPLGTEGVLLTGDAVVLVLAVALYRRQPRWWSVPAVRLGAADLLVPLLALAAGLLAVTGATRLDNGLGGGVTHATLVVVAVGFLLLFVLRERLTGGALYLSAYLFGLALLLMTSLRGDGATGHDVQHEMYVFLSTLTAGIYEPHRSDPYNACLSITVLPTMLARWTHLSDPWVYKALFQGLYALCPLLVLRIGARLGGFSVGVVSYLWFVGFLGFIQDMPMLNRQEIGFLFFAGAVLVLLAEELSLATRRTGFAVLAVGMVLAHYSTTYFAIAALGGAWALQVLLRLVLRRSRPSSAWALLRTPTARPWPIALGLVVFLAAASAIWTGPITGTSHGLSGTVTRTLDAVQGKASDDRAGEAEYAVVPVKGGTIDREARAYATMRTAIDRARSTEPQAFFADAPSAGPGSTPPVDAAELPLSHLGQRLADAGVDVPKLNKGIRFGSAVLLQLLVIVGGAAIVLSRRELPLRQVEGVLLGGTALAMTGLQVVLPQVSLEYGVARSFMQSLMVLGPFLGVGVGIVLRGRLRVRRPALSAVVAVAFFASSAGVLTQALGGYGPQLHLNNAGDYYDRYYLTQSELQTLSWVQDSLIVPRGVDYPNLQMDTALFNKGGSVFTSAYPLRAFDVLQPGIIFRNAYVVLSRSNVEDHKSLFSVGGYSLWYDYDEPFLADHKNLVYATGDTRIYR